MRVLLFFLTGVFTFLLNLNLVFACPCNTTEVAPGSCECVRVNYYLENSCSGAMECGTLGFTDDGWVCSREPYFVHLTGACGWALQESTSSNSPPPPNTTETQCGSVIKVENQALQENVPLLGSDQDLVYSSDRVFGRKSQRLYKFTVSEPSDPSITEVFIKNTIHGIPTEVNFTTLSNIEYIFEWDGLNALSIEAIDGVNGLIELDYEFSGTTRSKVYERKINVGFYNTKLVGLGGFTLSSHHFYNTKLRRLHLGNGNDRTVEPIKVNKSGDIIEKLDSEEMSFDNYLVASEDGAEAYIFSPEGYHLETRSTRTSKIIRSFSYDINMKLTSIEDAFGNEIEIDRPNSTTVEIGTPSGKITTLTLNADGFATNIETPNNEDYLMSYSVSTGEDGLMTSFEKPNGLVSTFVYDSEGKLTSDSNNAGNSVSLNVLTDEPDFKLIQAISAEGRITEYYSTLYATGEKTVNITKPTGAVDSKSDFNYNNGIVTSNGSSVDVSKSDDVRFGGQVYIENYRNIQTHGFYHFVSTTDVFNYVDTDLLNLTDHTNTMTYNAHDWVTVYDGLTQTYTTTTPLGRVEKLKLNDYDQVVETQLASYSPNEFSYDVKGRLEEIKQNTREWSYVYNIEDEVQSITNPLSETSSFVYDSNGRVIEMTYPNLEKAYFEYDEIGNIKKIKAGTKPWHEFLYTLFGGVLEYIMPDLGSGSPKVQYAYNNDKQLTQIKRENLDEINVTYGTTSGLLENIATVEGNYIYTIDPYTEQLTEVEAPNSTKIQYTYNSDRIEFHRVRDGVNNSSYKFDYSNMLVSRRTLRHQDSNSNVNHVTNITYNNDRLMTVVGAQTLTRTNATGLVASTSLTGGMTEQYTYDPSYAEISEYNVKHSATQKYNEEYTRDALGRTQSRVETVGLGTPKTFDYTYDSRGRLTEVEENSVLQRKYSYDSNSNRTSVENGSANVIAIGAYNDQDQLITYEIKNALGATIKNYTYSYDDFGNRLTKTDSTSNIKEDYVYNSLGGLESYTRTNLAISTVLKEITYKMDAYGRRLTKTEDGVLQVRYIYDETIRLVGEVTPNGDTLTHYVYSDLKSHTPIYMNRAGTNYKIVTNEQGSIRYVFNATTGAVVQEMTYDEFGNVLTDTNPGFQSLGFAGGLYDADTGLTRFGARDYDAEVGRWTAKDPISFNGGDINLYGYVLQDPVNWIDKSGKARERNNSDQSKGGSFWGGTGKWFGGAFIIDVGYKIITKVPGFWGKCGGAATIGVGVAVSINGANNINNAPPIDLDQLTEPNR